jgi:hypothetical protein
MNIDIVIMGIIDTLNKKLSLKKLQDTRLQDTRLQDKPLSVDEKLELFCLRGEKKMLMEAMDWNHVSRYRELSEEFINFYQKYVNWEYIAKYQTLSTRFKRAFYYQLANYNNRSDLDEILWLYSY